MDQIKSRPKRLDGTGRAQTANTSLSRDQYAWVLAQGTTVAQVLRQCVSAAMAASVARDVDSPPIP